MLLTTMPFLPELELELPVFFFICLFERIDKLVIIFIWKCKKKSKKEELSGRSHISILKTRTDAQTQLYKSRKRK